MIDSLVQTFRVSSMSSCRLVQFNRSTWYYKVHVKDITALPVRINELARTRVRYGYRRIYELLRREGWRVNHKRVHRLYVLMGLQVQIRRKIKCANHTRVPIANRMNIGLWTLWPMYWIMGAGSGFIRL